MPQHDKSLPQNNTDSEMVVLIFMCNFSGCDSEERITDKNSLAIQNNSKEKNDGRMMYQGLKSPPASSEIFLEATPL